MAFQVMNRLIGDIVGTLVSLEYHILEKSVGAASKSIGDIEFFGF